MSYEINRAAVIGAGTMGAAIAGHLANAGIPVTLLDIVPPDLKPAEMTNPKARNRIVQAGFDRMVKSKPDNLFTSETANLITLGNLEDDFDAAISTADWVIEVIVEKLEMKQALMARIDAVRRKTGDSSRAASLITSNTSGLLIGAIADGRSLDFRQHFMGTHFFNPPRYMKLVEVIPTPDSLPDAVAFIKRFCERSLGKGVVVCKDSPNYIANRIGQIAASYTIDYGLANDYTIEEVDALTGELIGRPKMGTFRLADLAGIDVAYYVSKNLYALLPNDPDRDILASPRLIALFEGMLSRNWLGNKTNQGFYKQVAGAGGAKEFWHLNPTTFEYEPAQKPRWTSVGEHRNKPLAERLRAMVAADDRAGQLIWFVLSRTLAYAANQVPAISDTVEAVDQALRWGFNWELGPFEIWDALGVPETVKRMEADGLKIAPWVKQMVARGHRHFYSREGDYLFHYRPLRRQFEADDLDENLISLPMWKERRHHRLIERNPSASLLDMGDGVLLVEFHSKMNALDDDITKMIELGMDRLRTDFEGMVIGNQGEQFCVGANLAAIGMGAQMKQWKQLDLAVSRLQETLQRVRRANKPVVTAPFGLTLGGGAEVAMAGDRVVATAETYMGLVEVGVGLIPAGGGCKEIVRRLVSPHMKVDNPFPGPWLQNAFMTVGQARVSTSAEEARNIGFLSPDDVVVMNKDYLLAEAKREVIAMASAGYKADHPVRNCYAAGRDALANLMIGIHLMQEGGFISAYDALVGRKLAYVLCGGDISQPQWVDEQYFLDLEREAFLSLLGEPKTLERIFHMLQTGKPLRN